MSPPPRTGGRVAGAAFGAFVGLQLLVALVKSDRHVLLWWDGAPHALVLLSWAWVLARCAVAGAASAWLFEKAETLLRPGRDPDPSRLAVAAILSFTVAGAALRFVAPVSIPPGVWLDALVEAEALLRIPGVVPWLGGVPLNLPGAHEIVSHLLLRSYAGLFSLLGRGDVGILSLSAVPGLLTVPAAAWLAWEAFGPRPAVVAAAFVALSSRELALSRWGYTPATLVPLALAAVAAALAARRRRSLLLAALSGVFAGLGMHTHSSALVVPVALAAWSLGTWKEPGAPGRARAGAAATLLAAAPWLLGFAKHPSHLGGRLRDVHVANPVRDVESREAGPAVRLVRNAVDYSGLFVFTRDPNGRHGFPGRAAAPLAVGFSALIGFALLLRRCVADPGPPRALLWLAAGSLAAGTLSDPGGAPNTVRACILVAVGFVVAAWVVDGVVQRASPFLRARPLALLGLVVTGFFVRETVPFLAEWPELGAVRAGFCPNESHAGRLLRRLAAGSVFLQDGAVRYPIVLETLAASPDPRVAVPVLPTTTPDRLLAAPPAGPFWLFARARFAEPLRTAGWSLSRPVPVGEDCDLQVFRVRPPATGGEDLRSSARPWPG